MKPTPEQQAASEFFATGKPLVIEAGAGTGKTTTLIQLAESTSKRGRYVAFNRAIVDDASEKMPQNVQCRTAHSLAFSAVGKDFAHRVRGKRVRSDLIARRLGVDPFVITIGDGLKRKVLQPSYLVGLASKAIDNFCNSADETPGITHVPYIDGIDLPTDEGTRTYGNNNAVARLVADLLPGMWADLCSPSGTLPYKHDHYLKLWERSHPRINADFILFDEAQDASPVMLSIVQQQQDHAQLVFVGDSQQSIYEWRGAVNALEKASDSANRTFLTQSFRFGPAIAEVANVILARLDAELRLTGTDFIGSQPSIVGHLVSTSAILCRTNAMAMESVLRAQKDGLRPFLLGSGPQMRAFIAGAADLINHGKTSYGDLACFDSWSEVEQYVQDDPQGDELALNVRLVNEYGVEALLAALGKMPKSEEDADLVVSTAHKAKGREWESVLIAGDFRYAEGQDDLSPSEWRLLYVAITRAKVGLDIGECEPLLDLIYGTGPRS